MVRKGYKQTEIGVIPDDWELKTISDIGSVSSGGTPSRTNLSYWNGTIPWITTTQIDFNTIDSAEQFITKDGLNNSAAKLFPLGTLLMAMYGQGKTRGKVAILGGEASTNQACAAILLGEKVHQNYIFHYLVSQYEVIRTLSNTGNQENLNGLIIKSIKIPFPPPEEQRSIAQALSDVDALIAALDKLIAKKRHLKTATMQQLLTGKKRLPGFGEGQSYKQTEVGMIPDDWHVKLLGDIFSLGNGFSFKSEYFSSNGPIVLTPGNFKLEGGLYFNDRNTKRYSGNFSELMVFKNGDLLVVMTDLTPDCNLLGKPALVDSEEKILHNQRIGKIRFLSDYFDKQLLYFLLLSSPYLRKIKEQATGSTVRHTSNNSICSVSLPIPKELEEQRAIATVLSDMDAEIATLETRLAKTQAIKQGMMQELLTGRTRLV